MRFAKNCGRFCLEIAVMMTQPSVEPFFALPWMITWFAHQLKRFQDVTRLYDVFLVSHPLFSLYVSAAVPNALLGLYWRQRQKFCDVNGILA
ncbi:hypothetical protein BBI17_002433 [Phytophthora kernoviae]|uniref:Rab-GAP TBC domain-containing protein n=2 Tax=Phytophthora kernoviae TaxID=325452 RepID=A0A3R7JX08_9STRA|nr:hypothetical protein G195_004641 [Phytophthora kernoviae 00238/432]KAG2526759.1 hypothetical protein JM16_003728 [Phytophthora kernoviae]KAG2530689.1 hypothetical protein JM18_001983 [Phytophthora kernoviae]RLN27251.1 hypothetical protein BBI17_002433 [Phytophthora kernoviae]